MAEFNKISANETGYVDAVKSCFSVNKGKDCCESFPSDSSQVGLKKSLKCQTKANKTCNPVVLVTEEEEVSQKKPWPEWDHIKELKLIEAYNASVEEKNKELLKSFVTPPSTDDGIEGVSFQFPNHHSDPDFPFGFDGKEILPQPAPVDEVLSKAARELTLSELGNMLTKPEEDVEVTEELVQTTEEETKVDMMLHHLKQDDDETVVAKAGDMIDLVSISRDLTLKNQRCLTWVSETEKLLHDNSSNFEAAYHELAHVPIKFQSGSNVEEPNWDEMNGRMPTYSEWGLIEEAVKQKPDTIYPSNVPKELATKMNMAKKIVETQIEESEKMARVLKTITDIMSGEQGTDFNPELPIVDDWYRKNQSGSAKWNQEVPTDTMDYDDQDSGTQEMEDLIHHAVASRDSTVDTHDVAMEDGYFHEYDWQCDNVKPITVADVDGEVYCSMKEMFGKENPNV